MAALMAGVQYGLSSHSNFHENKSLIFVKLTDSAQRAIEDFLRNRNKTSQNPTIQFLGNEGHLSFPSTQSSHGTAGFTFSLSGNQDIEGPQGGFECIQQTGPKSLESLGALPCKMRIQANDDVYETTRHRMAVAEENSKNKCTRVIKADGPDIGRKVKVKRSGRTIAPPTNARHRESVTAPPSSIQSSRLSSYKPVPNNLPPVRAQVEKKVSDIMRRPLKERLIHLLALRPYKKPELYDRINREGIKERERSIMTTMLKQVAYMRDNTYHLNRHVWNDVQEDWPFYSEQEKTMLKRRKPQNLTPPGSSDGGSSGSGQSPNSTHPGSPPAITAPPPGLLASKRPGYFQGNDGLPTKRPRISHYRKPEPNSSAGIADNGRTTGGGGNGGGSVVVGDSNSWDQRQQQRDRAGDYRAERTNSEVLRGSYGVGKSCLTPTSDSEDPNNHAAHHSSLSSSHNSHSSLNHNNLVSNYHSNSTGSSKLAGGCAAVNFVRAGGSASSYGSGTRGSAALGDRREREDRGREREKERGARESRDRERNNVAATTVAYVDASNLTDDNKTVSSSTKYPDYLMCYTIITSIEQRRRYKAEFNADYDEYRKLHDQVERISRRFSEMRDRFDEAELAGNHEMAAEIKRQVTEEFEKIRHDPIHREMRNRFNYLHEKLSHIKQLILEYDTQNSRNSGANSGGGSGGGGGGSGSGGGNSGDSGVDGGGRRRSV